MISSRVQADTNDPKDAIRVLISERVKLDLGNPGSVKQVFNWLRNRIRAACLSQNQSVHPGKPRVPVPVILGSSADFTTLPAAIALERAFPEWKIPERVKPDSKSLDNPNTIPNLSMIYRLLAGARQGGCVVLEDVSPQSGNFVPEPSYANWSRVPMAPELKRAIDADEAQFKALREGGAQTRGELIDFVKRSVFREMGGANGHRIPYGVRFIRFRALPGQNPGSELLNCFATDPELRQAAVGVLVEKYGLSVNLCIKCPQDKPSPPFVDVAAAHLADEWDRVTHGEIRPSAVMAKSTH